MDYYDGEGNKGASKELHNVILQSQLRWIPHSNEEKE